MIFPDKKEAVRFFMDVKSAMLTCPEAFQDVELNLSFADVMLKGLSGDWRDIDTLALIPSGLYEVNEHGHIRFTHTEEVVAPEFDMDYNEYLVKVTVNGKALYINGPHLAALMFNKDENA